MSSSSGEPPEADDPAMLAEAERFLMDAPKEDCGNSKSPIRVPSEYDSEYALLEEEKLSVAAQPAASAASSSSSSAAASSAATSDNPLPRPQSEVAAAVMKKQEEEERENGKKSPLQFSSQRVNIPDDAWKLVEVLPKLKTDRPSITRYRWQTRSGEEIDVKVNELLGKYYRLGDGPSPYVIHRHGDWFWRDDDAVRREALERIEDQKRALAKEAGERYAKLSTSADLDGNRKSRMLKIQKEKEAKKKEKEKKDELEGIEVVRSSSNSARGVSEEDESLLTPEELRKKKWVEQKKQATPPGVCWNFWDKGVCSNSLRCQYKHVTRQPNYKPEGGGGERSYSKFVPSKFALPEPEDDHDYDRGAPISSSISRSSGGGGGGGGGSSRSAAAASASPLSPNSGVEFRRPELPRKRKAAESVTIKSKVTIERTFTSEPTSPPRKYQQTTLNLRDINAPAANGALVVPASSFSGVRDSEEEEDKDKENLAPAKRRRRLRRIADDEEQQEDHASSSSSCSSVIKKSPPRPTEKSVMNAFAAADHQKLVAKQQSQTADVI